MNFQKLLESVESSGYGVTLGLVSTPRALDAAIAAADEPRELTRWMGSPVHRGKLVERTRLLIDEPHDPKYAHPRDLAVAVYLRILEQSDPDAALGVTAGLVESRQFWWAKAIARRIQAEAPSRAGQSTCALWINSTATEWSTVTDSMLFEDALDSHTISWTAQTSRAQFTPAGDTPVEPLTEEFVTPDIRQIA